LFSWRKENTPSLRLAYKVAKALNATIEELFMFDEENNPERSIKLQPAQSFQKHIPKSRVHLQ